MTVDRAVGHDPMIVVKLVEQVITREDPARRFHQQCQHAQLDRRELQLLAVEPCAMKLLVAPQGPLQRALQPLQAAPRVAGCFHPSDHLARAEGLADVVIGANFEAAQAIGFIHARAVRMITGSVENCRSSRHISMPLRPGSIRSSSISEGGVVRMKGSLRRRR